MLKTQGPETRHQWCPPPNEFVVFWVDATKRWPPICNKTLSLIVHTPWGLGLGQSKNRWALKSNYSESINRNTPIIHPQSSTPGTWSHDGETRSTEYPAQYPGGPFHHFQGRALWVRFRGWKLKNFLEPPTSWFRYKLDAPYRGFLKWWYPTTMGFPTKNDHFGVFWGYPYFRKPPYREYLSSHVFGTIKESQNFLLAQQNDICVGKKVTLLSPFSSPKPPNFHPIKIKKNQRPICHPISIPQDMIVALPWPADRKLKSQIHKASFFSWWLWGGSLFRCKEPWFL